MRFVGPRNAGRPWSFVAFPPMLEKGYPLRAQEEELLDKILEESFPARDPLDPQTFN